MPESYLDQVRSGTLNSLDPIRIDKDRLAREQATGRIEAPRTIQINPQRAKAGLEDYRPGQPLDTPLPPQRPHVNNAQLGWQEGMSNLAGTIYGTEGPYAPKIGPRGVGMMPDKNAPTLADKMKASIADQKELEANLQAQSSGLDRLVQFVGGAIPNATRYGLAEAATGGNPWVGAALGAPAADISLVGSEGDPLSGEDLARVAGNSAAWGAGFEGTAPTFEAGAEPPLNWLKGKLQKVVPVFTKRAAGWLGAHEHQLTEPIVETLHGAAESALDAGAYETTGEGVPNLFPKHVWSPPNTRPYGSVPQITMPPGDDSSPQSDEADAEPYQPTCGRNSRVPCYAGGGEVDDDDDDQPIQLDMNAIQREANRDPNKIYLDPDQYKRGLGAYAPPFQPVGPPRLAPQTGDLSKMNPAMRGPDYGPTREDQLRALYHSVPGPGTGQQPTQQAAPIDPDSQRSVFDRDPDTGAYRNGNYYDPLARHPTPLGNALLGFTAAVLSGGEAGEGMLEPANVAPAAAQSILQAATPPSEVSQGVVGPRDVKRRSVQDMEQRIPYQERVVSPNPTRLVNGQPFSSLDMNAPSEGFLPMIHMGPEKAETMNQKLFQDATRESEMEGGSAAAEAVRKTGMRPPTAQFLDTAMSYPQRARYWYELSGEGFTGNHFDLPPQHQSAMIDNTAATSGGAEPYTNMKRSIGTYAENLQGVPIMVDLRDPASVRHALDPSISQLGTLKYNNFAGTMKYTTGLHNQPPLSVNDVQMAKIFGVKGEDIGKNPVLYEVMSRYINKVRDAQNAASPPGSQPWETWQVQAPAWVHQRALDNPAKASAYDDYAQVTPRIIQELQAAGIPTPNGKITMDTLMDPRTPNAMSGTRETLMGTPVATVETATEKTPEGLAATNTRRLLDQYDPNEPWVREAIAKYTQIQRNAMTDFAERHAKQPSLVSQLMSEILGQKVDTSRIESNGWGTYEGNISPNVRIPMGGAGSKGFVALSRPQREAFLSMLGEDLNQDAMAASHFSTIPLHQADANKTYSVFMHRFDGRVDQPAIQEFSRQIGYPVNVSQVPNGVLVDVNIGGFDTRPSYQQIESAANATFAGDDNVHDLRIFGRSYDSDYVHNSEYKDKINAQSQTNEPRRSRRAGNPPDNVSNIERIRQEIRATAQNRDAKFAEWRAGVEARIGKLGGAQPPPSP